MRLIALLLASTLAIGCAEYDISVNDRLVYGPGQLLKDFEVVDSALDTCLRQGIADGRITRASDLTVLNCSHAGITSLEGIGQFSGLRQLKLTGNQIRNLVELSQIRTLENLWLDDNAVIDPVPLADVPQLALLDLSTNGSLQCPPQNLFAGIKTLILPEHCEPA